MNAHEGFRRVAVVAGGMGATGWIVFLIFATEGFRDMTPRAWLWFTALTALAFFAPWAIVRGAGLVIAHRRGRRP